MLIFEIEGSLCCFWTLPWWWVSAGRGPRPMRWLEVPVTLALVQLCQCGALALSGTGLASSVPRLAWGTHTLPPGSTQAGDRTTVACPALGPWRLLERGDFLNLSGSTEAGNRTQPAGCGRAQQWAQNPGPRGRCLWEGTSWSGLTGNINDTVVGHRTHDNPRLNAPELSLWARATRVGGLSPESS